MKFSIRHDIKAPIDFVFARAIDFDAHAKQALRRGVEVARTDDLDIVAPGMCWDVRFPYRGKLRTIRGELAQMEHPLNILIQSVSGGIEAEFDVEFLPLSKNRTRIKTGLQLLPKSISAKLLIQSLRFSKSSLDQRFEKRAGYFASDIQNRYARLSSSVR